MNWPLICAVAAWAGLIMQLGILFFLFQKDRAQRSSMASLRDQLASQGKRLDLQSAWNQGQDMAIRKLLNDQEAQP